MSLKIKYQGFDHQQKLRLFFFSHYPVKLSSTDIHNFQHYVCLCIVDLKMCSLSDQHLIRAQRRYVHAVLSARVLHCERAHTAGLSRAGLAVIFDVRDRGYTVTIFLPTLRTILVFRTSWKASSSARARSILRAIPFLCERLCG